jgi:hypothetical protein
MKLTIKKNIKIIFLEEFAFAIRENKNKLKPAQ